ncbi:MAG: hypothetical protein HZB25_13275 [Candidatus Eisenbacteria bacterium]|nr:hypothetical protein [Candidatus Eisenbacteria bacterium]
MFRSSTLGAAALVAAAFLAVGCTRSSQPAAPKPVAQTPPAAATDLRGREDAHHQYAMNATDPHSLHAETTRYATDMHAMMDTLMATCRGMQMSGGGMMGGHSEADMAAMTKRMSDLVDMHGSRMAGTHDIGEMRAECDAHHNGMEVMLAEMDVMMPSGDHHGHGMSGRK